MSAPGTAAQHPFLVQLLRAHPDVQVKTLPPKHDGYALYHIDFGRTLYVADSDDVLFVQVAERITDMDTAVELLEFLAGYGPPDQIKLVSIAGADRGVPFQRMASAHPNLAVVTTAELDRDVQERGFEQAVASALRSSIGPERLLLYQFRGAVTGNRFFGREHQVQALLRQPRLSYLVTGARMSGKTSLLLETKRQLKNQYRSMPASESPGIAYLDCRQVSTVPGLIRAILLQLEERTSFARIERWENAKSWSHFFGYLRGRAKRTPQRRLYLFLDEFDNVIDLENRNDVKLTWHFRALHQNNSHENGLIQFVLAGSKHLAAAQKNLSTGLHNFVNTEDCKLDNFDIGTVKAILERPLHDVGMEVDDLQEVAQVLISETGGRPASVQYVCSQVVRRMIASRATVMTGEILRDVVGSHAYLEFYEATLRENTDLLERFVLSAGERLMDRGKAGFKLDDILAEARKHGVVATEAQLYESLSDLDNAGFIRPKDDRANTPYVIAAPVIEKIARRRPLERLASELANALRGQQRGGTA
jgi:hypothetical protein